MSLAHEEVVLAAVAGEVLLLDKGGAALVPVSLLLPDTLVVQTTVAHPSFENNVSALKDINLGKSGTTIGVIGEMILIDVFSVTISFELSADSAIFVSKWTFRPGEE